MKVLHIWNTAGVGSIIAKYMDKLFGTESLVVHRRAFDPYGVTTYGKLYDCDAKSFALRCLLIAKKFDIIHVHALDELILPLKLLYPRKPVILHYHGSDIRKKWNLRRRYWSKADVILYSTPDLLDNETPKRAVYIPNPVDIELFHPCSVKPRPKTAFHISYNADDLAAEYAKKYCLELTIHNRQIHGVIPYLKLPQILCQYEYYIDVKRDYQKELLKALSKTALEALACGLTVITWDGRIVKGLPSCHRPENVCKQLFNIYVSLKHQ